MVVLFLLVTFGSLLTSLTGLGGGTLILAGLLLVYPPELALPLHSFTQFTANAMRAGIYFKKVSWKTVAAYALLMLPAAWLGAELFEHINSSILKIIVGTLILASVIPWKFKLKSEPKTSTFVVAGALSGFMGIFVGAVGPMVTPLFNRLPLGRDGNLATKSAGQMCLQLSKIIAFGAAAGVNFVALKDNVGILVAGSIIGVGISIPLGKKISDQKFDLAVNVLLGIISLKVIYEGFSELGLFS